MVNLYNSIFHKRDKKPELLIRRAVQPGIGACLKLGRVTVGI
jgi:hypothetical protein